MPARPALVSDPLLARKKAIPKWEWLFCDCPQVLLSACPPRISQGKECVQGKPLPGFPCAFNQRAAVGGADFCSAKISSTKREPPFGWLSFDDCRFLQSKNQSCQRRLLIERAGENRQRCPLHTFLFWRYAGARTTNLWAATKSRLKCASLFAQSGIKNALLRILPEKGRRGA